MEQEKQAVEATAETNTEQTVIEKTVENKVDQENEKELIQLKEQVKSLQNTLLEKKLNEVEEKYKDIVKYKINNGNKIEKIKEEYPEFFVKELSTSDPMSFINNPNLKIQEKEMTREEKEVKFAEEIQKRNIKII